MKVSSVEYQLEDVLHLLNEFNEMFNPPLSSKVDIKVYAEKLSRYAHFLIAEEESQTIGYLAYYKNQNVKELYITSFCVSDEYRRKGMGKKLLNYLYDIGVAEGYLNISLEVRRNNETAIEFYKKMQFEISQTRDETFLMNKRISIGQ